MISTQVGMEHVAAHEAAPARPRGGEVVERVAHDGPADGCAVVGDRVGGS